MLDKTNNNDNPENHPALDAERLRASAAPMIDSDTARNLLPDSGLSPEMIHNILVAAGHAYIIWGPNDDKPYISTSLADLLGYPADEFTARYSGMDFFRQLLYPADVQGVESSLCQAVEACGSYSCECRLRRWDGSFHWVRLRGAAYEWNEGGVATRLWGCISDIHELKVIQCIAEQERERSRWLSKVCTELFEAGELRGLDHALGELGQRLSCNRAYLRLKHPVSGLFEMVAEWHDPALRPMEEVLPPEMEQALQVNLGDLLREGTMLRTPRGQTTESQRQIRDLLSISNAVLLPLMHRGNVQGAIALMADVEPDWDDGNLDLAAEFAHYVSLVFERHAISQKLKESEERFHLAMETTQDGIWDFVVGSEMVYVSPSYFRMTGHDLPGGLYPQRATGQFVHPDDLLIVRERIRGFLASPLLSFSFEFRMCHRDGSVVWI